MDEFTIKQRITLLPDRINNLEDAWYLKLKLEGISNYAALEVSDISRKLVWDIHMSVSTLHNFAHSVH